MYLSTLTRAAGAVVLALGLTGCIDVEMNVDVLGEDLGRVTTTISIDQSMYEMSRQGKGTEGFCDDDSDVSIVGDKAICVDVIEGDFATLMEAADSDQGPEPTISVISPGMVRVTFPTGTLVNEIAGGKLDDEATKEMIGAMFAGHAITVSVSGHEIVETNMALADDKRSASIVIEFDDLIAGTAQVADESFAVVKLN